MQATSRHAISYADVNDPQRINDITAAIASSIDNAIETAHRRVVANYDALPAIGATGLVAGRTLCWTTSEGWLFIYSGTSWLFVGGNVPAVALQGAAVTAVNNPTSTPIPWSNSYLAPVPSSMWVSGSPWDIVAPLPGLYHVDVMTRWPDGANVEIALQREGGSIANGPRQYGTRNNNISSLVQLARGQRVRVAATSYSGNQALSASSSHFAVNFLRTL